MSDGDAKRRPERHGPTPAKYERAEALRSALQVLPTSRFGRLWRFGRSAAGMAGVALGRGTGASERELEAVARLVSRAGELKGLLMKAGQIFGYIDPSMPDELRALLSVLQTSSQAAPFSAIEGTLRQAFGSRADELLARLERAPIAVASIAQVHRAELSSGPVAVKVLHPGIADAIRKDFETAGAGAAFARLLGPGAADSVASNVKEARTAILEECDLALEAERQRTFERLFAGDDIIAIPAVRQEWCASSVLTSDWCAGRSLDAFLAENPAQAERDRLGVALFRFYIGTLYRHGLFHADPHPGNYAFVDDGRLVIYDFGCVRRFDTGTVTAFAALVESTRRDDLDAMTAALIALGAKPPKDLSHLRTLLRGFFAPLLVSGPRHVEAGALGDARMLMRDKRAVMRLALPGKLLFLFRLRFGLYAVLARLGAVADWSKLESSWAAEASSAQGQFQAFVPSDRR